MRYLVFLFILFYSNCFAQWQELNSNTKEWLTSLHFINDSTGFTCGNNGLILKSTNYGNTWIKQVTNTKKLLRSIHFIDENIGIASGDMGIILRTTNGGTTWDIISDTTHYYALNSIYLADKEYGWIVGGDYIFSSVIFKTTDGGKTWHNQLSILNRDLISVSALDRDTVFIIDFSGKLIKSVNGGQSWSLLDDFNETLNSINMKKNNVGYIVGSFPHIYKTINNGESWIRKEVNACEGVYLHSISVFNNKVCLVGGHYSGFYGIILTSSNSGESWERDSLSERLWDVQFVNNNLGYAVGDGGGIYKYSIPTNVERYPSEDNLLTDFVLSQNYPNPFNPQTTITFSIRSSGFVKIRLYDSLGKLVKIIVTGNYNPGKYIFNVNMEGYTSGIYFYSFEFNDKKEVKKMLYMK